MEGTNALTSPVKAVHTHLQRGLEILLVGEVGRGSEELGASPTAELPREGCACEDVWREAHSSGLLLCLEELVLFYQGHSSNRVGLNFRALPCCSMISSTLAQFVQQLQSTKG